MATATKTRKASKKLLSCTDSERRLAEFEKAREKGRRGLAWKYLPKNGVLVVTGFRGEGKTALTWWIADTVRKRKGYSSKVATYDLPPAGVKALPSWARTNLTSVSEVSNLDKPHIVVVDEAAFSANARRAMSEENVQWTKLFAVARHKGHLLIFISQSSRQVDIQMIDQADWILMKKPSMLQVLLGRDALKAKLEDAFLALNAKRNSKEWVYVYDARSDAGKLLPASMPKWWTDKLSKAYSTVSI